MADWKFVTNHGAVLSLVAQRGKITAREIAAESGITERSVHRILKELEDEGYVERRREGQINVYEVDLDQPIRRDPLKGVAVGDLLNVLSEGGVSSEGQEVE